MTLGCATAIVALQLWKLFAPVGSAATWLAISGVVGAWLGRAQLRRLAAVFGRDGLRGHEGAAVNGLLLLPAVWATSGSFIRLLRSARLGARLDPVDVFGAVGNTLWWVEPTTGLLTRIMGDGTAASSGNSVPAAGAQLGGPTGLYVGSQNVLVADRLGHSLRQVTVPMAYPRDVALSVKGGSGETVIEMQPTAQPFQAGVAFVSGGPLPDVGVDWLPALHPCRPAARTTQTDAQGRASVMARLGFFGCEQPASFRRLHAPLTKPFTKNAGRLPKGQIATFVNERGLAVNGPLPELGALATTAPPTAVAGPYFVSGCAVRVIDSDGYVSAFAGDPTRCGFSGDGGPARDAFFARIGGVSFDSNAVYIADTGNNRIRRVDSLTGIVTTVEGGGTGAPAGDGDGGPATAAILSRPEHVLAATGALYLADNGHQRIRAVDSNGVITSYLAPTSCNGKSIAFQGCAAPRSCSLAGSTLNVFVAGNICGSGPGGSTTGIVRAGIGLSHVAGKVAGSTSDGALGPASSVPAEVFLGADFDVYFADPSSNRVRRIDAMTNLVSTVVGTGTAGLTGDYGSATQGTLSAPAGLWLYSGTMRIADTGNSAIRAGSY